MKAFGSLLIMSFLILTHNAYSQTKQKNTSNKAGSFIVSFTIIDEKPRFNAYKLLYKPIEKKINFLSSYDQIIVQPSQPAFKKIFRPDFVIDNQMIHLFHESHNIGIYDFFNFELFTNLGMSQSTNKAKQDFSIPFEIKSDTIIYLGDVKFYPTGNKNGKLFEWSNQFQRDSTLIYNKFKINNSNFILIDIPKKGQLIETYFDLK